MINPPFETLSYRLFRRVHGGLIHIPIQPQDSEPFNRCRRPGLGEPTFKKTYLNIQQTILRKVRLHLSGGYRQLFIVVVFILGIACNLRIWLRQPAERIRAPHTSIDNPVSLQDRTHHNACSAAPNSSRDEIAGNVVLENNLGDVPQVGHPCIADHAGCLRWPVATQLSRLILKLVGRPVILIRVFVYHVDETLLPKI
jgi:hypothetical protein